MTLKVYPVFPHAYRSSCIADNPMFNQTAPLPLYNFSCGKKLYRADEAAFEIRKAIGMTDRNIPSFLDENARKQTGDRGNQFAVGFIPHEVYRGRRYYSRGTLDKLVKYLKEDQEIKDAQREASGSDKALAECMAKLSATSEYDARMDAALLESIES